MNDEYWMRHAMRLAERAAEMGEVPVGAVVVRAGEVVGEGWNQPISRHDPTAHAEIMALRAAGRRLGNYRLVECDLYVTIEPCTMCAGALVHARVRRLVYGAPEPKAGVVESACNLLASPWFNHTLEVQGGVLAQPCSEQISAFFQRRRALRKAAKQQAKRDIGR